MSIDNKLKFYVTPPHPCSYLKDQQASTLFLDPNARIDKDDYGKLAEYGFRRSGDYIYRPHCENCNACTSIRICVQRFNPSKSQKRILKKNQDLTVIKNKAEFRKEHYQLYERYINERHSDGDMYPPSEGQYKSFLLSDVSQNYFYEFYLDHQLVAICVHDLLEESLSAVYTFFDTKFDKRSLGTHVILWLTEEAKRLKMKYVYLGYHIENCDKMNYKTQFHDHQLYINDEWVETRVDQ